MARRVPTFVVRRLERAFESGRILAHLIGVITVLAVVSGVLIWIVDRKDYPTLGLALWWAVQTVTTVGYGDVSPVETSGRIVATVLMVAGFASLSLLTGIIASLLVREVGAQRSETGRGDLERRLTELERRLGDEQAD
jgi:voltage-gated potassium channel